jgi:hypothetical protein
MDVIGFHLFVLLFGCRCRVLRRDVGLATEGGGTKVSSSASPVVVLLAEMDTLTISRVDASLANVFKAGR